MSAPGARALVLSGRGRYADAWHDHAATSHRVAQALTALGHRVEVRGTSPQAAADLDAFDLVVVNSGDGRVDERWDGDDRSWAGSHLALHDYAAAGGRLLGLHQAAMTFRDSTSWPDVLGGRWVPETSMHPPWGRSRFHAVAEHPIVAGLRRVEALDERYAHLELVGDPLVLMSHEHEGVEHPVVWVNSRNGYRVVYDALGHDVRSYDSPSRLRLLLSEVSWLLEGG